MTLITSVVLGFIQGIGEFLPISSSAHLILIPYLLGWKESSISFDIALHFGTLLAVLVFFFQEWWILGKSAINNLFKKTKEENGKLFWYLVVATIPAAISGYLLDDVIEQYFRNQIWLIALLLAIMGILIYLGDRWASKNLKKEKDLKEITLKQAFLIGCSQIFALIPGFSRSGTTILAGRILGISREAITKFTFLLAVPIIAGATILKVSELQFSQNVIIGIFTSFITGLICIKFLLKYIKTHDFSLFAFYRLLIAIIIYIKLIWF